MAKRISDKRREETINLYNTLGIVFDEVSEEDFRAPKKVDGTTMETIHKRLKFMNEKVNELLTPDEFGNKPINTVHVYFSTENSKMGKIASVSRRPITDCHNCSECWKLCYDVRNDMYEGTMIHRAENAAIYIDDKERYFHEIDMAITENAWKIFRWHIGADIEDLEYFDFVVEIAKRHPETHFLIFTKMYDVVNEWEDTHGGKWTDAKGKVHRKRVEPKNLSIVFSAWVGMEMNNPYKFKVSNPIFTNGMTTAHDGARLCNHNCAHCAEVSMMCYMYDPEFLYTEIPEDYETLEIVFPAH